LPSIRAKVAPSTFTSYRQNRAHVADRIGHVRLDALDALDALYADLEAAGIARAAAPHSAPPGACRRCPMGPAGAEPVGSCRPAKTGPPRPLNVDGRPARHVSGRCRCGPPGGPVPARRSGPGCGLGSWWRWSGPTSTWTANTSRSGGPRPLRAADGSNSTRPPSPCSAPTADGRRPSGSPSAPGIATTAGCTPAQVVSR
jgi:hypothetical protein